MKFDLNLVTASLAEMPDRVDQARSAGYDGLFVAETRQDPFSALAIAGSRVNDIDLGSSIALAFTRSPMTTAVASWELHRPHGRFILGLGSQVRKHIERRYSCAYDPPLPRLREYVAAVRHIWGAFQGVHPLDFQGEFFTLDFLPDVVNPGPIEHPEPEIYLASLGPLMYRTAGAVADGAFVHPLHTVDYLRDVAEPAIAEGLAVQAKDRERFALSVTVFTVIGTGESADRMRESVRSQLAFYSSTPTYRRVLEHAGWDGVGERLQGLVRAGRHAEIAAEVPDDMLDEFCIVAETWPEAADVARARYAGVADRISFYNPPAPGQALR
ncbi:TIGR03617 family F420-dependent LLM class oxidoreductase [Blastococcus tunisiensis]|uniref:Probable F420-dependent oxidoreductase, MSMEG_2256 family n=1 Tax=Blastococcus tunisiensis TaxID=1798228 RepID=A0A1I2A4Q7_9ACTN|nr:TIGR03617 family F420-dependent LLM class oxidoreductase [Blastococcus sp. DSM 46838]SFE38719.1 probable F420-dependent oxidoreductase, MSMEG_2256 family [Blastococcus sp. DSM 46838]